MSTQPADTPRRPGPLEGMRIVDISQQLPGPYASMLLQDLGARVIKVEPPVGDSARHLDPEMFSLVNRDKDIVTLDLKRPTDVRSLHDLVRAAEVFIEGFRPGVASRLGADWKTLSALNPALVYCSISACGQAGPYARLPMHDLNLQGLAGLEEGHGIGVPWVDLGTATSAALTVVSYWQRARATGTGAYLDAAMLDTAVLWFRVKQSAHGRAEPTYGMFSTSDGHTVSVAILEDHIWKRLCEAFDWKDWLDASDLGAYSQRVAAATLIRGRLELACRTRKLDELMEIAIRYDLPLTPAGNHLGAAGHAQLSARGLAASVARNGGRQVPTAVLTADNGFDARNNP